MNIILRKPIITEKSMKFTADGLYTFMVGKGVTKPQIAKAVGDEFKVDVVSVKTINVKGVTKWQRRVRKSYTSGGFKKAMIQLKKGQKIAMFEAASADGSGEPKQGDVVVTTAEGEPIVMKEKKDILGRTKIKIEKGAHGAAPTTQRKVITGK